MATENGLFWRSLRGGVIVVLLAGLLGWAAEKKSAEPKIAFSKTTVDFGLVVSDIEKSVAFYKNALGCTELEGFDVPGDFAADSGLADGHAFHVHVMVLGDRDDATKIKLMQFKDAPGKKIDQAYIHSSLGMSYMTIFVEDVAASVASRKSTVLTHSPKAPSAYPKASRKTLC